MHYFFGINLLSIIISIALHLVHIGKLVLLCTFAVGFHMQVDAEQTSLRIEFHSTASSSDEELAGIVLNHGSRSRFFTVLNARTHTYTGTGGWRGKRANRNGKTLLDKKAKEL